MIAVMSLVLSAEDGNTFAGSDWKVPSIGMEFAWTKALDCWVGKYEVMNCEYQS